jgi:Lectin C-type domain/Secretion system C-terminal sorting domain/SprB repeat
MKQLNPLSPHALHNTNPRCYSGNVPAPSRRSGSSFAFYCMLLLLILSAAVFNTSSAQTPVSPQARAKLLELYKQFTKPEISFERFAADNSHLFPDKAPASVAGSNPQALAIQDPYCNNPQPYCANGDFETGLDQPKYTGAYGVFTASSLYPDPFALTYGFLSGAVSLSTSHQTIVTRASGNDAITGIPQVPANGGNQALRLGNTAISYGTELIAKTIVVDPSETILNFYYAVVLQDPGHPVSQQPAFSVRAYDCGSGLELPNVCNLGNGTNTVVSNAANPFFKSLNSPSFGLIAYRDWSRAQIDLSAHVGKKVIVVFTNKDCGQGGHFGYTYLDNLFSGQCPPPNEPGVPSQGSVKLNLAKLDSCGNGQVCVKYTLPFVINNNITTTGSATITLDVYQNNALVRSISSPTITTYPADSTYCFAIDPSALGLNAALGGFDYAVTGRFTLSGFAPSPIIVGNPPAGQKAGVNNDYLITCPSGCNLKATVSATAASSGNADGTVTISASGGTAPYTYVLNGTPSVSGVFTGLAAGSYPFTVTDDANCKVNGTITINTQSTGGGAGCPGDTIIIADPSACTTVINWKVPSAMFPDTIQTIGGVLLSKGTLKLKAEYNGHGYYQSDDEYSWPDAKTIAASLGGHLVTITDAGESNLVKTQLAQPDFGSWIGLFNNGSPGSFEWVTGETFSFTNWNVNEPNNENGSASTIAEPYVHIRGAAPNDGWNDISANWNLPYIAEFDNAVLTYTQTSGPAPGSTVAPGVYNICYEIKNSANGTSITCCFKVTVVCSGTSAACPKDTIITTTSANCEAEVKWTLPSALYPDSISIAGGSQFANGFLTLKGTHNGHGYYQSDDDYSWPDAKTIAAGVGGHLVTITDAAESNFIKAQLPQADFGSWIGLFNNGLPGSFEWVTGETFSFTDWNVNEPNNFNGTAGNIAEPYVHIRGAAPNDRWNDISPDWNLPFIAEFDSPLLTYTQVSGVPFGSTQLPGVYPICYEITNTLTGAKTICCFKVTVVCNPAANNARSTTAASSTTSAANARGTSAVANRVNAGALSAAVYPNPSRSNTAFSIRLQSNNLDEKASIKVLDMMGRIVEAKAGVQPNSTITMGQQYRPGMYFVQVMQGNKTVTLRVTRQ